MLDVWFDGIKSNVLNKIFNASLNYYLKLDHNVSYFFTHFDRVLKDKWYKELKVEYKSYFLLINTKISVKMLIQAREVYTNKTFEDFQD